MFTPINERNREDLPVLSVTQDQGVVLRNDLAIDIKYDKSTLSSYKVIHPGDFVISLRSFQGGFELSKVLGISSPAYTIFDLKNLTAHNKLYWKYIFKSFKFIESLKTVTFGIRDGKSISFREFSDLKINYPSDASEQEKIGSFFQQLDETIDLHHRKLEQLKTLKQAYLQQLFPKNEEKVPKVRFATFYESWEPHKLNQLVDIKSGITGDSTLNSGNYQISRIETISNGTIDFNRVGYINENPDENFKLKIGDILYSNINSITHIGKVAQFRGECELFHGINLLRLVPKTSIDSNFVFQYLLTSNKKVWAMSHANRAVNQASINQTELGKQIFMLPNYDEQVQVGLILSSFEIVIALYQQNLEKLNSLKESLLQKLFI